MVENIIEVTEKVTQKQKKRALILFCGTESVTRALEVLGFEVVTLDIRKSCAPTNSKDILEWDYKKCCHQHEFEVVFASVPRTKFSKALTTRPRNFKFADKIARKILEIFSLFQPEKTLSKIQPVDCSKSDHVCGTYHISKSITVKFSLGGGTKNLRLYSVECRA